MSSKNVFCGVLGGIAAGALLGILLAPGKGTETRKYISRTGNDLADALKEKFNEIIESISGQFVAATDDMSEPGQKAKNPAEKPK